MNTLAIGTEDTVLTGATSVVSIDPRVDPLWPDLLSLYDSSVFHSPDWIKVVTETYGWDARAYVLVNSQSEPLAGVPYCRVSDIMGDRVVILPFSDFCDPLIADARHWGYLAERLYAEEGPFVLHCLNTSPPVTSGPWEVAKRARWHGIDLRPELSTIWGRFDHVAQGNVRKAQREGVTVRIAETEADLRLFFDMHLRVRKYKHHLLAQPYSLFEHVWGQILSRGGGVLLLAERERVVIAGGLFLEWNNTIYYKFNTSIPEHLGCRPNELLTWYAVQYAKAKGYRCLDFGRTDWDHEALARYKRKFAAEEKTITQYRYGPERGVTCRDQLIRGLLPELTALLTDPEVSDNVTEKAGDLLYRFFV